MPTLDILRGVRCSGGAIGEASLLMVPTAHPEERRGRLAPSTSLNGFAHASLALFAIAAGLLLSHPVSGAAQEQAPEMGQAPDVEHHTYRALISDAIREYGSRNFAEARSLFSRAYEVSPNARVMRGLGMAEFELRNYISSIDLLTRALASPDQPLTEDQRAQTVELLERAQGFIGRFTLALDPVSAIAMVDEAPVTLNEGRPLMLQVGDHLLEVSAPGFAPTQRTVKVTGGELARIKVRLVPVSPQAVQPSAASVGPLWEQPSAFPPPVQAGVPIATGESARPAEASTIWESPFLWTGAGLVVVGVGIAMIAVLSGGDTLTASPIAADPAGTIGAP